MRRPHPGSIVRVSKTTTALGDRYNWPLGADELGEVTVADPHSKVLDYVEELTATPRAHLPLELRQDDDGLKLLHQGRPLVECYMTREGMAAGGYMAKALGAPLPPVGESVAVRVSTGVLFRAVSIASLDFGVEESFVLLERLLEEAEMQRGGSSDL